MANWLDLDLNQPLDWAHPLNRGRVGWWQAGLKRYGGPSWYDLVSGQPASLTGFASGYGWQTRSNPGGRGSILWPNNAGSGSYVTLPLATDTNTLTITGWLQANAFSPYAGALTARPSSILMGVLLSGASGFPLTACWNSNTQEYNAATGLTLTPGSWQFFCWVVKPSSMTLYLSSGTTLSSYTWSQTNGVKSVTAGQWQLGRDSNGSSTRYWQGAINDIGFSSRAWSAAEVTRFFTLSQQGYPGLLNYQIADVSLFSPISSQKFSVFQPFVSRPRLEPAFYE